MTVAIHFDQKFLGTEESYDRAREILHERGDFQRVAVVPSGADTVEIYICRAPGGIFNYAYASITILGNDQCPCHPDVTLSSGRTITHVRAANGAQDARPTTGPEAMTVEEWEEYAATIRSVAASKGGAQ